MKKALVVDDTKNIRNLLTTCLELNDFEVLTAINGEDALNIIEANIFDLIFLDIKMPEVSGTKVLKTIRDNGIDTPVIIMTAFATVKNAIDCTKLGAVAYLQKPFTIDKVNAVLLEVFNELSSNPSYETELEECNKLLDEGNIEDAYSKLKKLLSINPSNSQCYYLIGKYHEFKGNNVEATKFFRISKEFN